MALCKNLPSASWLWLSSFFSFRDADRNTLLLIICSYRVRWCSYNYATAFRVIFALPIYFAVGAFKSNFAAKFPLGENSNFILPFGNFVVWSEKLSADEDVVDVLRIWKVELFFVLSNLLPALWNWFISYPWEKFWIFWSSTILRPHTRLQI